MKTSLIKRLGLGVSLALASCGSGGSEFQAGEWELEGWMENEGSSERISYQTHSARVSDQLAMMPAKTVAFTEFYHGANASDVVFENGEISGFINQGAVAPFPEHTQDVTGWYKPDAFEMRIKMPPIAGFQIYQVVKGELVRIE